MCKKKFTRDDSLKRHNKTFHAEFNGDHNKQINMEAHGNHNIANVETQNNIQTQNIINNPIIIQPVIHIHPYDYNGLNDLTLFEQYLSLASKDSPHSALLDHLNLNPNKPSYHNIYLGNLNKNHIDIHNGEKWIKEMMNNAVSDIIDSKSIIIKMIFDKFRCFLGNKALYHIPRYYHYYGFKKHYYFHKKLIQRIKIHLYNNRHASEMPNENIPENRKDKIFWALSKQFTWPEVENLLAKMEKLKIDLIGKDLNEIKQQILNIIKDKPKSKTLFKKFLKHLDYLIDDFKTNSDDDTSTSPSSSSDDNKSDNDE